MSETLLAEKVLTFLKQHSQKFLPALQIAADLKIPAPQIPKAVTELKKWGYKIREKEKSYRLKEIPDLLLPFEIKENLKTKILAREIHCFLSTKSTNEVAFRLAESEAPEGTLVVAEKQTAGKGRLGRKWFSPPHSGIWMSLILRPEITPAQAPALSILASLAIALSIEKLTRLPVFLKWPNDTIINHKKVAGVLTELSTTQNRVNFVIVGIGVNINQTQQDFPASLMGKATSLRIQTKNKVSRVSFLKTLLEELEKIYNGFKDKGLLPYSQLIRDYSILLGKSVKVKSGDLVLKGKALDIDENGSLVLDTRSGKKIISAGDVTIIE